MTREFIRGLKLSELFYWEAVRPILDSRLPGLRHSAARIGSGSDVLGFDTTRSTDHGWGPRLELFVSPDDYHSKAKRIGQVLSEQLPYQVHGYSTHFSHVEVGNGWMADIDSGPITHGVSVHTVESFFRGYLGVVPRSDLQSADWLVMPEQRLRTVTTGRVYYDGLGELEPIRTALAYYPKDIWLYLLACQWRRIDQEQPFMGRAGEAGDELGSRIIAARMVREVMRLCFLMERQYAPYTKWFGTGFQRLECAPALTPLLAGALTGTSWREREVHLSKAYEYVADMHNKLGVTAALPAKVSQFYDRPYLVIHAGEYVDALRAAITDETVRRLPPYLGSVEQFADSTDVLSQTETMLALRTLYL